MRRLILLLALLSITNTANAYNGKGCTTAFLIDQDCDGYGVGVGYVTGPDADDADNTVNTTATVESKYGNITTASNATIIANLKAFFSATRGYSNIDDIIFVSPTGDDATGVKNDITHPFRYAGYDASGGYKNAGVGAGDLILYRGGVYDTNLGGQQKDQIDVQYGFPVGTASAPIVFASFPGEVAEFSADIEGINGQNLLVRDLNWHFDTFRIGKASATTNGNGIVLTGARDVKWSNIEVLRKGSAGVRIMSYVAYDSNGDPVTLVPLKNILLDHSIIRSMDGATGTHNIYWGHAITKANNNPATGCVVKDIISYGNATSYDGMQYNGHFTGWKVTGSQFHSASGWGFSIINGPSSGEFSSNLIFNNNTTGIKIGKYVGFVGYAGNGESTVDDNLIANNTIWVGSTYNGNGSDDGRTPTQWNPIYFYTETPCKINPIGGASVCGDITTYHSGNIIRNNILISHGSGVFRSDQRNHLEHNTFDHNILVRGDGTDMVANLKNETETWTFAEFEADGTITASDNISVAPDFVDIEYTYATTPGSFDFRLADGSAGIGDGVAITAITTDITNKAYDSPPTIGAYEYSTVIPDPDQEPATAYKIRLNFVNQ